MNTMRIKEKIHTAGYLYAVLPFLKQFKKTIK